MADSTADVLARDAERTEDVRADHEIGISAIGGVRTHHSQLEALGLNFPCR
ncbi:hypothetical protein [Natrinema altunense]|uniref:hypothetical protein n=1 Tax=Natrinema altunense TaxID=222984 RepID=UPI0013EE5A35|nr:hypothetical protein [Natrinema altunense]